MLETGFNTEQCFICTKWFVLDYRLDTVQDIAPIPCTDGKEHLICLNCFMQSKTASDHLTVILPLSLTVYRVTHTSTERVQTPIFTGKASLACRIFKRLQSTCFLAGVVSYDLSPIPDNYVSFIPDGKEHVHNTPITFDIEPLY